MSRFRALWRHLLSQPAPVSSSTATNFVTALDTLDVAFLGSPFAEGAANVGNVASLSALDVAFLGAPFAPGAP